ncbi:MAG: hypothetical protein U0V64_04150 [Cyclobacteriaceae bacterium]
MRYYSSYKVLLFPILICPFISYGQVVHVQAHSHNDYFQARPLLDALDNRFNEVEADIYDTPAGLVVSHERPGADTRLLEQLYFRPIDSLIQTQGSVQKDSKSPFMLMLDFKSSAARTYQSLLRLLKQYPRLACTSASCPVIIFISGNRPLELIVQDPSGALKIDGRPEDLGKGHSSMLMPVISDRFQNWCSWNGKGHPSTDDGEKIRSLANKTHQEGKKLRLWSIPDHEEAWAFLIDCGVDLINTDHLAELNRYLQSRK